MKMHSITKLCLTVVLFFVSGSLWAQNLVQIDSPNFAIDSQQTGSGQNSAIIFSNLGPFKTDNYDSRTYAAIPVAGKKAVGAPETWVAVNFIPRQNVQATVLQSAITYISGTKLVNLGLYSDADGKIRKSDRGRTGQHDANSCQR